LFSPSLPFFFSFLPFYSCGCSRGFQYMILICFILLSNDVLQFHVEKSFNSVLLFLFPVLYCCCILLLDMLWTLQVSAIFFS
jgi:hypothetical protein